MALPDPAEIGEQERLEAKRKWQRECKRRRKENDGQTLGRPTSPHPDGRTPEQKAADEEARRERQREYHREWYLKKKSETAAKSEMSAAV